MKNWHLIEQLPLLSEIYRNPLLISYKRGQSLNLRAKLWKGYFKHALGSRVGLSTPFYILLLHQKRPFSSISFTKRSHLLGKFCLPLIKGEVSVAGLMRICWFCSRVTILSLWALSSNSKRTKPTLNRSTLINVTQQQPTRRREDALAELAIVRKAKCYNNWMNLCD